jgi:hypothetical protein
MQRSGDTNNKTTMNTNTEIRESIKVGYFRLFGRTVFVCNVQTIIESEELRVRYCEIGDNPETQYKQIYI